MINDLLKNFKVFCKMCDGTYREELFPECKKYSFKIGIEYLEKGDMLAYLVIKIVSDEGDEEILRLEDVRILEVRRISENDENGTLRFYTLYVKTNKGIISLKRDIRENKLVVNFENKDIWYRSTVIF